jgi:hypothetical protein
LTGDNEVTKFKEGFRLIAIIFVSTLVSAILATPGSANSSIVWSVESDFDTEHDSVDYNSKYDVEELGLTIWSDNRDELYFYMYFKEVPFVSMFNDGFGSYATIFLDYNLDGQADAYLWTDNLDLKPDLSGIAGTAYDAVNKKTFPCPVDVFTNINAGKTWVGFVVSRSCIGLPNSFKVTSLAKSKGAIKSDDFAPWPMMSVTLFSSSSSSSNVPNSGGTTVPPKNLKNSSYNSLNFNSTPVNLSNLSESLLPSVVTVKCNDGSGTGWSAESQLSSPLITDGMQSLVVTNYHVIERCMSSKSVSLLLSNGANASGKIVSWDKAKDIAGIATSVRIPSLQWIGSTPQQGWWVGVIGSPLGQSNVLTTGIISSINTNSQLFTITAAINPGNSGGPVFDNTGRVLGLATSKAILSSGQLAEGFGNAHGVPMLCGSIIECIEEVDPWNSQPRFAAKTERNPSITTGATNESVKVVTTFKVITCTKGNLVKKIKAKKPKCPKGYKRK